MGLVRNLTPDEICARLDDALRARCSDDDADGGGDGAPALRVRARRCARVERSFDPARLCETRRSPAPLLAARSSESRGLSASPRARGRGRRG